MGIVHSGIPQDTVIYLKDRFGLDTLVETGTFKGATAEWASGHFAKVITVELSPSLHLEAAGRLRNRSNIELVLDDSRDALPKILKTLEKPALFWLDGHWTATAGAAGQEAECPLLEELDAINRSKLDHLILIDDARLFLQPPPPPHRSTDWPTLERISEKLSEPGRRRYVRVFDDVIFAVPESSKRILDECFQDRGNDRRRSGFIDIFRTIKAAFVRRLRPRDPD